MGATTFTRTQKGTSMQSAFTTLYNEAKEEYGHQQGYSGEINSTSLTRDLTSEYRNAKDKKAFLNELENRVHKWETWGVELEPPKPNKNKVKSKVEVKPQKGAKKWETRYIAVKGWGDEQIASEKTQGLAIKKARAHTEKTQERTSVHLTKVLTKGDTHIADITYKKSTTESLGKYFFAVCAPE